MTPATSDLGRIDRALLAFERLPAGRWLAAAAAAAALLALASGRAALGTYPTHLGASYAALSLDPFTADPSNPVGYRILTPLLSWMAGLRGRLIVVTNLAFAAALLALAYDAMRALGHRPGHALLGAAVLALTMPVLGTLRYAGYCDALTYLLVLVAWRLRARPAALGASAFLALLNHESALFLLPWLAFAAARPDGAAAAVPGGRRRWMGAVALLVAVAAFLAARRAIDALRPGVPYSAEFYLEPLLHDPLRWYRASADHRGLGVFSAFGLFWVLPPLAVLDRMRRRDPAGALLVALPPLAAYAALFVAYDVTRMMALGFMGVWLAAEHLLRTGAYRTREWLPWLAAVHYFVPQVNVAMGRVDPMR